MRSSLATAKLAFLWEELAAERVDQADCAGVQGVDDGMVQAVAEQELADQDALVDEIDGCASGIEAPVSELHFLRVADDSGDTMFGEVLDEEVEFRWRWVRRASRRLRYRGSLL